MQLQEKKMSQKQRAGQENSYLMFIILLEMVTSQELIAWRQHSKAKCALKEKCIFLYAECADFFVPWDSFICKGGTVLIGLCWMGVSAQVVLAALALVCSRENKINYSGI